MDTQKPKRRRSIRLRDLDYARFGPFFVTICSERRICLFGAVVDDQMQLNTFGKIVEDEWLRTAELRHEVVLDAHVVMPNHFHGIVSILNRDTENLGRAGAHSRAPLRRQSRSLGAMIAQFKATTTTRINERRGTSGSIWQRNYYEHVIRNERELQRIRDYIAANPARWAEDGYHPRNIERVETGAHSRAPLRDR